MINLLLFLKLYERVHVKLVQKCKQHHFYSNGNYTIMHAIVLLYLICAKKAYSMVVGACYFDKVNTV